MLTRTRILHLSQKELSLVEQSICDALDALRIDIERAVVTEADGAEAFHTLKNILRKIERAD